MILSDTLSHRPDHGIGAEHDNEDVTLLPETLFVNLIDLKLQQCIHEMKDIDPSIDPIYLALKRNTPSTLLPDLKDWKIERINEDEVLYYKDKLYIPKDIPLRWDILKMFHDHKTAGHPGELETYNSVRQHYWWPGLKSFVKNYVQLVNNSRLTDPLHTQH